MEPCAFAPPVLMNGWWTGRYLIQNTLRMVFMSQTSPNGASQDGNREVRLVASSFYSEGSFATHVGPVLNCFPKYNNPLDDREYPFIVRHVIDEVRCFVILERQVLPLKPNCLFSSVLTSQPHSQSFYSMFVVVNIEVCYNRLSEHHGH